MKLFTFRQYELFQVFKVKNQRKKDSFVEFTVLSKKSYFDDNLSSKKIVGSKSGSLGLKRMSKFPKVNSTHQVDTKRIFCMTQNCVFT